MHYSLFQVASSTWSRHFITLANPGEKKIKVWSQALQRFAPSLWPLPLTPPNHLAERMEGITSLVIVRNPLSRLSSVYHQKIIDLGMGPWKGFNDALIGLYRTNVDRARAKKEKEHGYIRNYEFKGDDPRYPRYVAICVPIS